MIYPLPLQYRFQIVRVGTGINVRARLLDDQRHILKEVARESYLPRPTSRISAGTVLFQMLRDVDGGIRELLGDKYDAVEERAADMAGLTLCQVPAR